MRKPHHDPGSWVQGDHRPWPGGIAAITLFAEDLGGPGRFCQEVFGLEVVFEDAQSAVLQVR